MEFKDNKGNQYIADILTRSCVWYGYGRRGDDKKPIKVSGHDARPEDYADFYNAGEIIEGHSLVEMGDVIDDGTALRYSDIELIPRRHVVPEYGVFKINADDDPKKGISYRMGEYSSGVVEIGKKNDLELLLKCTPASGI